MSKPSAIESLKRYCDVRVTDIPAEDLRHIISRETDRTAIVILGSALEDELAESIRDRLRPMDAKEIKDLRLFDYDGPIGSFSVKINVAYALGLIDESMRAELHDIRAMRNACAHCMKPISFETPELANVCKRLFMKGRSSIGPIDDTAKALRYAFMVECVALLRSIGTGSREAGMNDMRKLMKDGPG